MHASNTFTVNFRQDNSSPFPHQKHKWYKIKYVPRISQEDLRFPVGRLQRTIPFLDKSEAVGDLSLSKTDANF